MLLFSSWARIPIRLLLPKRAPKYLESLGWKLTLLKSISVFGPELRMIILKHALSRSIRFGTLAARFGSVEGTDFEPPK
jgi:hypothetical protein